MHPPQDLITIRNRAHKINMTKKNLPLRISALSILIASLICMATPALTFAATHNAGFEKGSGPWKQWPRGLNFYHLKKGSGIGGSTAAYLQGPGDKHARTLYDYARIKGGAVYALSWQYALNLNKQKPAPNAKAGVQLLFNKPGGGNGSAGRYRHNVKVINPSATSKKVSAWRKGKLIFIAPKEATKVQLGFYLGHITDRS